MSTHGIIARPTDKGWCGRYYHWEGIPSVLGEELWKLYHGFFQRDLAQMLKVLVDEHPAGWSDFIGADWALKPGFSEAPKGDSRPHCLCHGDRKEEEWTISQDTPNDAGYAFVLLEGRGVVPSALVIYGREILTFADTRKRAYSGWYDKPQWYEIARIALTGLEPNWGVLDRVVIQRELRRTWGKIGRVTQQSGTNEELAWLRAREKELREYLRG